jgi:hypothetical protein
VDAITTLSKQETTRFFENDNLAHVGLELLAGDSSILYNQKNRPEHPAAWSNKHHHSHNPN